jgi:hypothetical protein
MLKIIGIAIVANLEVIISEASLTPKRQAPWNREVARDAKKDFRM